MIKTRISILFILLGFVVQANPIYKNQVNSKEVRVYEKIGSLYELIISDIDSAEIKIDELIKENEKKSNTNIIIELLLLEAELYRSKGDFSHMKLCIYQALNLSDGTTTTINKALINYYKLINKYTFTLYKGYEKELLLLLKKAKELKFKFLELRISQSLGKFYSDTKNFTKSEEYLLYAKNIALKNKFDLLAFDIDITRGINFYWKGNFTKALSVFHATKEFSINKGIKKSYLNSILNLGEAHLYIDSKVDSAKFYFDLFLKEKNKADIRDLYQCYKNLYLYYKNEKDYKTSSEYNELMHETDEKIRLLRKLNLNKSIDEIYFKLKNERKLNDDNQRQKLLKIIFGLIGLFFLIISIGFWIIIKEKANLNKTLTDQKDELTIKKKQLDQSLKEKEILLKEIHHRVKNNLQIISSLLNLQTKKINDKKANEAINEAKDRIQAMALIHQKLYQFDTFVSIEMQIYLEDLIQQLSNSYNHEAKKIHFKINANNIVLNLDTVVPLGLIVCELVTNSFKYALSDKDEANLKIELSKIDSIFTLTVRDNGSGMKENFDYLNSQTLGVEIIQALTEQLDGNLSYKSSDKGTSIKIIFKEIKSN